MKNRLRWIALLVATAPGVAQAAPKVLCTLDLRPFGLEVAKKGSVAEHHIEMVFLSEDRLLLRGSLQSSNGAIVLDVSPEHVSHVGAQDTCGLIGSESQGSERKPFNAKSLLYFDPNEKTPTTIRACKSAWPQGVVNTQSILCLKPEHHIPIVVDYSGVERYRLKLHGLPWNPHLVSSTGGGKFGLEWTSNTRIQLLSPFSCIDECPMPARQNFMVFASADGKLLASFSWDPRPSNLYVVPAISPEGKRAAFVNNSHVEVYALD